jgi:membrane protein required for colicin V production
MNSLDIGILLIAALFFIRGIFRGFVFELVTVVGLILGYIISITYLSLLSGYFLSFFPTAPASIVNLLGWLNRLLGGLLGILKSIIIMSILVFIIDLIPFSSILLEQVEVQTSELYPVLDALGPRLYTEIQKITAIFLPG